MITVSIQRLNHGVGLELPDYQTAGSAGLDLRAALQPGSQLVLEPGAYEIVPTGVALSIPDGFEGQVRPRSGLAARHGVTVLNAPGTIDADYRGEVGVILINHGAEPFVIRRGERIAQLVIAPIASVVLSEVSTLASSSRGAGGFGSTGVGEDAE